MQNQSRCCLLNLLPILEARGNCCDKIDEALKYCQTHMKHEITEMGGGYPSEENHYPGPKINIFIRPLIGEQKTHTVLMSPNATVGEMKTEIEKKSGIPVNYQRNFHSQEVRNPVRLDNYDDQRKLGSYNLMNDQTLYFTLKIPGSLWYSPQ